MFQDRDDKFKFLFENMAQGIFYQRADGVLIDVNPAALKIFGLSKDEFLGKTSADPLWKVIREDGTDLAGELHPSMVALKTGKPVIDEIVGVFNPNKNNYTWIVVNAFPQFKPKEKKPYQVFVTIHDITKQKKIKDTVDQQRREIAKSEALFRGLFDHMTSGSAIYEVINDGSKGSDYIIKSFNNISLKIEEKTLEQVIGKSLFDLRPNIDDYGLIPILKKVWETGTPAYYPVKIYQDKNFSNYYENYVFKIPSGEVVTIYNDVTTQKNAEKSLKENKERLDLAMQFSNDGLYDWNLETNQVYYSAGWKKMLGYRDDEIKNEFSEWERLTDSEDVKISWKIFNELIDGKRDRFELEFKMLHKKGHWVNILSRANVVLNENGKAVRVVGTHVDISERKQTENELRNSEEKYRIIAENMADVITTMDMNLRFTYVSPSIKRLRGYTVDEAMKQTIDQIMTPDSFQIIARAFEEELRLEETATADPDRTRTFELEEYKKDGSTIWVENRSSFIRDEDQKPVGILVVSRDISERKLAEQKLDSQFEFLKILVDTMPSPVFYKDTKGRYTGCNNAFELFLGISKEEIIGRTVYDLAPKDIADKYFEKDRELLENPGNQLYEWKVKGAGGELKDAIFNKATFNNSAGEIIGLIGIITDITEHKRAEDEKSKLQEQLRQAQKMESIGTLAGGIAHDFNNILSSIIGFTELALDDVEKGTLLEENLQEVFTAGNRAKDLIRQILTISRHDAMELKPILINSVVKEAVKMLRSTIPTSINIQENICDKQLVVKANPTQIHQVIINLATNAKHAMSETGGVLVVDVESISFNESTENIKLTPGEYARITVSDTGIGINKDHLEKIFEPYFTTKSVGEGSGLGLSVVHGIIKSHKGDIAVYSESGKETKFHIYLPLSEQHSIELPDTNDEPLPRGTEHILLVDDEPSIVKMQQRSLERLGYTVTIRTSSIDALETFCVTPDKYDLIITDMTMPDMTGDKLADEIKKIRPDVPVILCTGFSEKINIRPGADLQIDEFILKPIDKKKLAKIIRKVVDEAKG